MFVTRFVTRITKFLTNFFSVKVRFVIADSKKNLRERKNFHGDNANGVLIISHESSGILQNATTQMSKSRRAMSIYCAAACISLPGVVRVTIFLVTVN